MKNRSNRVPMGDLSLDSIFGSVGTGVSNLPSQILGDVVSGVASNPSVQQSLQQQAAQQGASQLVQFYNQNQTLIWGGVVVFTGLLAYLVLAPKK